MKREYSTHTYIQPNDKGKPCMSLGSLLSDVADLASLRELDVHLPGLSNRPAKGRQKVRITLTVEEVK